MKSIDHPNCKGSKIFSWFDERLELTSLLLFLSNKRVPRHKHSFWYIFGGLSLFFFLIQIITGVLLLLYYSPTPTTAHESVSLIMTQVPFGWFVRSLHTWSANLMVATVLIHLFSVYFMKAYRKPRELMWISGTILLITVLGFGFTGYLLPWDTTAYFATQIGTEIPRSIPIIGDFIVTVLRGGEFIAEESLKRLFALHVVILPLVSLLLVLFHIILNQVKGSSTPIGIKTQEPGIAFYPNYIYRDAIAWTSGLLLLCALSLTLPVHLGIKADPYASAPVGIKPEWYFLVLYETLRLLPSEIFHINSEAIMNVIVLILGGFIVSVPFLDHNSSKEKYDKIFTFIGIIAISYLSIAIILAYIT